MPHAYISSSDAERQSDQPSGLERTFVSLSSCLQVMQCASGVQLL